MIVQRSRLRRMLSGALFMLMVVCMFAVSYSIACATQSFVDDYNRYQQENGCIQAYIDQGVSRRNINRDNGTCYIKE
jgi:hypothetical protein